MDLIQILVLVFISFSSYDCRLSLLSSEPPPNSSFDIELLVSNMKDQNGNIVVSPASVRMTLAMILEATEGKTAAEIKAAFNLTTDNDYNNFRDNIVRIDDILEVRSPGVSIKNTNLLLISNKLKLNQLFKDLVLDSYKTYVQPVNFSNPEFIADGLNKWTSYTTKGLIDSSIEPDAIKPETQMLLTNIIYYMNTWQYAFSANETTNQCFFKRNACMQVAMMELNRELKYSFISEIRSQAVELPYQDGLFSMLLLVPTDKDGIEDVIKNLPKISLKRIQDSLALTDVTLWMPKFTIQYKVDLVTALHRMKIETLFTPRGNLTRIFDGQAAYIDSIFHEIYLSVDEKGTVAAASTSAMLVPLIASSKVQVLINRPFLFFILDNLEGTVVFEGIIEEPLESQVKIDDKLAERNKQVRSDQRVNTTYKMNQNKTQDKNEQVKSDQRVVDHGGRVAVDFKEKLISTAQLKDDDDNNNDDIKVSVKKVVDSHVNQTNNTQPIRKVSFHINEDEDNIRIQNKNVNVSSRINISNNSQVVKINNNFQKVDKREQIASENHFKKTERHWYDKVLDFFG